MTTTSVAMITMLVAVPFQSPLLGQNDPSSTLNRDFAPASPESQGMSGESLRLLANAVRSFVDQDEISGAEFLVVKNRHTVLHETFGWRDREQKIPMERNTIFNVRSMTKPLTGMAAQMLIDAGHLRPDDKVSKYLPSFANDKCRTITVEQLLTHRSGLPLMIPVEAEPGQSATTILKRFRRQEELVDLIAKGGPQMKPGEYFQYSDAGSEVLGALVAAVGKQSLGEFIRSRILLPLNMTDAMIPFDPGNPHASRVSTAYLGLKDNWVPYWRADSGSIYPFAMGSQSLYCTPLDYAKFLAAWLDGGTIGEKRILSSEAVQRALTPVSDMDDYGTGFQGLKVKYGQMWMLYVPQEKAGAADPLIFGHGGSDGTVAWVWPKDDLMILCFTQNRGTRAMFLLEQEIDRLLLNPVTASVAGKEHKDLEFYLGTYALKSRPSELFVTTAQEDKLILEVPSGMKIELLPADAEGIWHFSVAPTQGVSFNSDRQDSASGMWIVAPVQLRRSAGPTPEVSVGGSSALEKFLGAYVLPTGAGQKVQKFELVEEKGGLVFKGEDGSRFVLGPRNNQDRWPLIGRSGEYVTFQENGKGDVIGSTYYQMHECVRTEASASVELSLEQARKYLGTYYDAAAKFNIDVIYENGHLAVKTPALPNPVALRRTGTPGVFRVPLNPNVSVRFNEDAKGNVVSHTVVAPNGEYERPRVKSK